jgi:hypothetical protein
MARLFVLLVLAFAPAQARPAHATPAPQVELGTAVTATFAAHHATGVACVVGGRCRRIHR